MTTKKKAVQGQRKFEGQFDGQRVCPSCGRNWSVSVFPSDLVGSDVRLSCETCKIDVTKCVHRWPLKGLWAWLNYDAHTTDITP